MKKNNSKTHLQVPDERRSVQIINELKEKNIGNIKLGSHIYCANARLDYPDFKDPKSDTTSNIESSLGLIDLGKCKAFGEDTITKMDDRSLPFNPAEMTARSTAVFPDSSDSKENTDPNIQIERIINAAKMQSRAVDDLLSESSNPEVQQFRQSLSSYRNSISGSNLEQSGFVNFSMNSKQNNTNISDSNFQPQKVDLSNAELSWIQENGILPVKQEMSDIDFTSNSSSRNMYSGEGEVSLGQYFKQRNGEIRNMIKGKSPQKSMPAPLISPENTRASVNSYKSPFGETFNKSSRVAFDESSGIPPITDESWIKCPLNANKFQLESPVPCRDITNTTNFDSSTSNSMFSLTNIKNIVEQMSCETPTNIIDRILFTKKNKQLMKPIESDPNGSLTPVGKTTFGKGNIFHSTKHGEDFLQIQSNSASELISPTSTDKLSSGFVSTLKNVGKSNSGSSEYTETSIKSANTVIPRKMSNVLQTISENRNLERSPLTPSESSRELRDLMSPASNSGSEDRVRENAHTPRRLINEFRYMNSNDEDDGWITPTPAGANNDSKECIPTDTPHRSQMLNRSNDLNVGEVETEHIQNIPLKGKWIEITSEDKSVLLGLLSLVKIKLKSLGNRWMNVTMNLDRITIDDTEINDDLVIAKIPTNSILLKADSKVPCNIQVLSKIISRNIQLHFSFNLIDMVTKSTYQMKHVSKIVSEMPKILIQMPLFKNSIDFPIIPENSDVYLPIVITNEHDVDLPITLAVDFDKLGSFSVAPDVSIVSKSDIEDLLCNKLHLIHKNTNVDNNCKRSISYILPADSSIKVLVNLKSPKLNRTDVKEIPKVQTTNGNLNVYLQNEQVNIRLSTVSISGQIGIYKLLLRNSQKSNTLTLQPGSSELVELTNAGNMRIQYKLFVSNHYSTEQSEILSPSDEPIFKIDKPEIELIPGERMAITVSFPTNPNTVADVRRTLVFESPFSTEIVQLIGTYIPRSQSQASSYSVDSEVTHPEEIAIKATKKGLSWGCVKIGEVKIQDIVFKNPSTTRKLRLISTITQTSTIGDAFKIVSDSGLATSYMFTLQPLECRTIRVGFRPSQRGGHTGALRIARRINPGSQTEDTDTRLLHRAALHGVGEEATLVFKDGVFRHGGTQDLPLGSLNNTGASKLINFTIWNKGDAPGFFLFAIDLKWKYRCLQGEVTVAPDRGVILPGETMKCSVIVPRRAVLLAKKSLGNTETLATLQVLHGNETTRLRIKKIQSDHFNDEKIISIWTNHSQGKLETLCTKFPGEDTKLGNVHLFKETTDALKILLDELIEKEVTVTYDVDLDNTIARLSSDLDETLQFQTMCADSTSSILEPNS